MIWSWIPGVRCGPFYFGEALPSPPNLRLTLLEPAYEGADWRTYRVGDDEARVRVDDDAVAAVECTNSLMYLNQVEILGLSVQAAKNLLGEDLVESRQWDDGTAMLELEKLGLTLWVESGRVESATVEACLN